MNEKCKTCQAVHFACTCSRRCKSAECKARTEAGEARVKPPTPVIHKEVEAHGFPPDDGEIPFVPP